MKIISARRQGIWTQFFERSDHFLNRFGKLLSLGSADKTEPDAFFFQAELLEEGFDERNSSSGL